MSETTERKRKLKKPIEEIRAELMKDPHTARIAKAVQMELGPYVEKVLEFLEYPDRKPTFNIADEADARATGYVPKTEKDIHDIFAAVVNGDLDPANKYQKSGFEAGAEARKGPVTDAPAGAMPSAPKDDAERQALMDQVKKSGGGGGRV
jgi:hypothetical protein